MPDIRDIQDPAGFLPEPSTPLWVWLALVVGILGIVAGIMWFLKRRSRETTESAINAAREEISQLKENAPETPLNTGVTELSLTIRRYLASAFHDPALFETNEEFSLRADALPPLQQKSKDEISQRLQELNELKYIPASKRNQTDLFHAQVSKAEELLDHIEDNLIQSSGADANTTQP